jgi:hypothetical protein
VEIRIYISVPVQNIVKLQSYDIAGGKTKIQANKTAGCHLKFNTIIVKHSTQAKSGV